MENSIQSENRNTRIEEIVLDVLHRRLTGEVLPDEQVAAQHPELMPELIEELRLVAELNDDVPSVESPTIVSQREASGALNIRCPHCHQRVEILADTPFTDITCTGCGSHFSLAADPGAPEAARASKKLGHFELIQRIGLGSFGTVWKARDVELDRTVAIKIPRQGKLAPSEVEPFLREARAAAPLNHANIVAVHEVGRDDDTVFIVSDLVCGDSLEQSLKGRRPTFREAAELCATIGDALHHAHEAGVIHRDLKPQDIMVDADGRPYLMDFGLARRDMGEITMTLDGHVLGTPAYMSPEQARGEAHRADRRTDIYSLGVILFELLTGELPFRGNARVLIHQVLNEEAPSPRSLNGNVPRDLETICLKCLEKEPHGRFATARDVADELRRFLAGQPIQARPVSAVDRGWRWCKRYPVAAALATLVLAIAVIAPVVAVSQHRLRNAEAQARRDAEETRDNYRWLLYCSDMSVANQAWHGGDIDKVRERLRRHVPNAQQTDLRGFGWYYLWQLCRKSFTTPVYGQLGKNYGHHLYWTVQLDYTHEGGALVLHRRRMGDAEVYDLSAARVGQSLEALPLPTGTRRFWYFPTSETFVAWNKPESLWVAITAFSRDGDSLATAGMDGKVILWDVATGERRDTLHGHSTAVSRLAFSPEPGW